MLPDPDDADRGTGLGASSGVGAPSRARPVSPAGNASKQGASDRRSLTRGRIPGLG